MNETIREVKEAFDQLRKDYKVLREYTFNIIDESCIPYTII